MNALRLSALAGLILAAAASRLIPHAPNFSPIAALAIFGGAIFSDRRLAFFVPLAAMFLSDLAIGLHSRMWVVYGSFALIVCLGFRLRAGAHRDRWIMAVTGSAVSFFVLTNLGEWATSGLYPRTWAGLMQCYVAAIPFFQNTLLSDILYSVVLFGALMLAQKCWPMLAEVQTARA